MSKIKDHKEIEDLREERSYLRGVLATIYMLADDPEDKQAEIMDKIEAVYNKTHHEGTVPDLLVQAAGRAYGVGKSEGYAEGQSENLARLEGLEAEIESVLAEQHAQKTQLEAEIERLKSEQPTLASVLPTHLHPERLRSRATIEQNASNTAPEPEWNGYYRGRAVILRDIANTVAKAVAESQEKAAREAAYDFLAETTRDDDAPEQLGTCEWHPNVGPHRKVTMLEPCKGWKPVETPPEAPTSGATLEEAVEPPKGGDNDPEGVLIVHWSDDYAASKRLRLSDVRFGHTFFMHPRRVSEITWKPINDPEPPPNAIRPGIDFPN